MSKSFERTIFSVFFIANIYVNRVLAHGLDDIPVFEDASIKAVAALNASLDEITYEYTIANAASNTGDIWLIDFDVSTFSSRYTLDAFPQLNTAPLPLGSTRSMIESALASAPFVGLHGSHVVPIGMQAPLGWAGAYSKVGKANFAGLEPNANIAPGQTLSGFAVISKHPPSLREATLIVEWFHISDSDSPSEEEWVAVAEATEATRISIYTLGTSRESSLGSHKHWSRFVDDVTHMFELGWVSDAALVITITDELSMATTAMDAQDGTAAKQHLESLRAIVNNANSINPEAMRAEATALLLVNIDLLIEHTNDTPIPFEPVYSITPELSHTTVNEPYELVIKVVNAANQNLPVQGFELSLACAFTSANGEDNNCLAFGLDGKATRRETDANGEVRILIDTPRLGEAVIDISASGGEEYIGQASVTWSGGPDLVVPLFIPPLIQGAAGNEIQLREKTMNQGSVASDASITRYFLSDTTPINTDTAYVVGERAVEALTPGEQAPRNIITFTIPPDLPEGIYALKACADADNSTIETNENNNCSDSELATIRVKALPVVRSGHSAVASISDASIEEGDTDSSVMTFDVTLDRADLFEPLTLDWRTEDVSALATEDYASASGSLRFEAGTSVLTQTIGVTVYGDQMVEPDESFNVVLSNPNEILAIGKSIGVGTILNDDSDAALIDCNNAYASPARIWPPNHKFKKIHIQGITHAAGLAITTQIDAIYQDEPVNADGDGNTAIDGRGIGKTFAEVRRERSGLGDGRIYEIQFTASSESGDSCTGSVIVGVPHDRKRTPIDSGVRFDSTVEGG